ncbi:non-ribosomal peptide synthetase [Amycolatopsis sp. SID8362]|uniref:amino acid adenylation domain-containing protein n=1 Tax=Amycolatopsis sp. SID8362 TaxID=2690346 RepID=UPI00136A8A97|nr:non-ribosomal peptide synthetase [Amycolatopsis sp. SID8362]NBH06012.1 amino acid adenylation domain-containing protein [Amycolatopsis sp. SID8362]NED42710.1 amino acid adenylation domain-containing protein [Amycolatopsis sp. SID8362]
MTEKTLDPRIALDFWVRKLGGCEPSDRPVALTPSGHTGGRGHWSVTASEADLTFLRKASRGDAQAEMVLYNALYHFLLSFYFGPDAGVVAVGGLAPASEALTFHTGRFDEEGTLRDAIGATRAETLEAAPYRDYPWDGLRGWIDAQGDVLDVIRFGLVSRGDAEVTPWLASRVAYLLEVPVTGQGTEFTLTCAPGCDGRTASRFLHHFVGLVRSLRDNLDRPLRRIPVLTPAEVGRLAGALTGPAPDPELPASLLVDFRGQVAATPDAVAVVDAAGALSYRQLDEDANRLARFFREEHGLGRGDFVAVALPAGRDLIVAVLATLKAGAAYVPIDLRYPADRQALLIEQSGAAAVVVREPGDLPVPVANVIALGRLADRIRDYPETDPGTDVRADDSVYVIFTSGSTGTPKGVAVEHGAFRNLLAWYLREVCDQEQPDFLLIAPVSFDLAQKNLFAPLLCGGRLHLPGTALDDYSATARYVDAHGIDVVNSAPSAFYPLLEFGGDREFHALRSLRHVVLGGEPIDAAKLAAWTSSSHFRASIMNSYGPTEFTDVVSYHRLDATDLRPDGGPIPIGRPIDGIRLFVLNPQQRLCPPDTAGELYLGGAGLSKGYLNDPEQQARRFVRLDPAETAFDGVLYRTGDLVRCEDGDRLEFLGRADDQVKINGFRIEPGEVERAIRALDGVADVVVCAKPVRGEDVLVAYYIAGSPLDPRSLREQVARTLPPFAIPTYFVRRPSFPRSPSGKLDRRALPAPRGDDVATAFEPPATPVEERLARLWARLLDRGRIARHDDFFALGGHSLTAIRLVSYVSKDFGVELSVGAVFEHSRLDDLAAVVSAAAPGRFAGIPRLAPADDYELSNAQRRLWLASQFESASQAYNLSSVYEIRGEVAAERLERALLSVIGKHESLRTVFRTGPDGEVRQVIRTVSATGFHLGHLSSTGEEALAEFAGQPFDLAGGPLLRAALGETADGSHVFAFAVHHSVCDAWSLGVFVSDLLKFYDPAPAGPPVAELGVQYKDYTAWLRDRLASPRHDAHRAFWRATLAGIDAVPPAGLPGGKPRPVVKTHAGAVVEHAFPASFAARVEELGARHGCTLFMVLVAALKATLFRQSGQPDITLGTPVAGRDHVDLEDQIGFYVNTVPLRTTMDPGDTFGALLAKVKAGTTAALEHRAHPFDAIVDDLALRRDPGRSPVFDLLVVLQNATDNQALGHIEGPGFRLRRRPAPQRFSKFDATFTFADRGSAAGLAMEVEYNTDLYDEGAVRRFAGAFETVLADACDDATRPLGQLRCVPAAERDLVLAFGRGRADPGGLPFATRFADRCAASANDPALLVGDQVVTYAQLGMRSDQFAGFLTAELGVRPGDHVAILLGRDDWLVVCLLGVLKAGAAFVPLDPAYPDRRIEFILGDCHCDVVVDAPLVRRFRAALGEWPAVPAASPSPEATAYVIYTSGSTGNPKGVQITHDNLAAFLQWCLREFAGTDAEVVFAATSICFDLSIFELCYSLVAGKAVRIIESPAHIGEWLGAHRRVLLNTVPSVIMELARAGHDLSGVTAVNVAGEPAPPALREVLDVGRTEVRNLYGPSEDTTYSTVYRLADGTGAVPIGRPVDNTRVYVLDAAGHPAGIDVAGEIHLAGRGLCRGYVNRPELDAAVFTEHPEFPGERLYRTGDHARWRPDGNLEFLGRRDAQVKIRGRRIELGEIEVALQRLPGVRQVAVLVRGEGSTAELDAYYVADEPRTGPDEVRRSLAAVLPGYLVPAGLARLGEFPLTPNGKVDRRALLARGGPERPGPRMVAAAPETGLERRVLAIWQSVVAAPGAGVDDSYFDLGGDSLRAMTIIARLNEDLGAGLRISDLYYHPTVRALAAKIRDSAGERAPRASSPAAGGARPAATEYPITTAQAGVYYLQRLDPRSTAYNIPLSFAVRGPLDETRFRAAVRELVRRHDAFRTRFAIRNRQVVGLVEPTAEVPIARADLRPGEETAVLHGFVRPFDLAEAPLMRIKLAKSSDVEHYVVIDVHHIVFDGASVALLFTELIRLYRGDDLDEPGLSYADYALLAGEAAADERARQRAYWIGKLGGERAPLALPFDFPKGAVQRFSGGYVDVWIGAERRKQVESLAREAGTTVFSVLFSLFAGVLAHIGGQDDVTVGIPVECRRDPRIRATIGMFVNTLAVRVRVDRARGLRELVEAHATELFAALDHQEYPFETLVRDLGLPADGNHPPLFEVMFAYYPRLPVAELFRGEDLAVGQYHVDRPRISKFPVTFLVDETEDGFRVSLNYDSSLFRRETAEAMADVVRAAFGLVANPAEPLSELPLL